MLTCVLRSLVEVNLINDDGTFNVTLSQLKLYLFNLI